jgi:hypothetical protein
MRLQSASSHNTKVACFRFAHDASVNEAHKLCCAATKRRCAKHHMCPPSSSGDLALVALKFPYETDFFLTNSRQLILAMTKRPLHQNMREARTSYDASFRVSRCSCLDFAIFASSSFPEQDNTPAAV